PTAGARSRSTVRPGAPMSPRSTTSWGRAVRDWQAFVRDRLRLPGLPPERESHIVRELAAQLDDFYREARAGGASEEAADAHACGQIRDWEQLARDVWLAERPNARPRLERLADELEAP